MDKRGRHTCRSVTQKLRTGLVIGAAMGYSGFRWGGGRVRTLGLMCLVGCYSSFGVDSLGEERDASVDPRGDVSTRADAEVASEVDAGPCQSLMVRTMGTTDGYSLFGTTAVDDLRVLNTRTGFALSAEEATESSVDAENHELCLAPGDDYVVALGGSTLVGLVNVSVPGEVEFWTHIRVNYDRPDLFDTRATSFPLQLERREDDSRYEIQVSRWHEYFAPPREDLRCTGDSARRCHITFQEYSESGAFLGAGIDETRLRDDEAPISLDTRPNPIVSQRVRILRPGDGPLAELELGEVVGLTCMDTYGQAHLGEVAQERCFVSGGFTLESTSADAWTGHLDFAQFTEFLTRRVSVRLGALGSAFEARVLAPCCSDGALEEVIVSFPEVHAIDGGGRNQNELWARIDAPGFEHAYVEAPRFETPDGPVSLSSQFLFFDAQGDGTWNFETGSLPDVPGYPFVARDQPHPVVFAGAVTHEGAPWGRGLLISAVRRRLHLDPEPD